MDTHKLILDRMQRLLCLGLEGQPAADLITGTARIWNDHLGNVSPDRLMVAFNAVEQHCKRWPTVAHIRECLPTYALPHRSAPDRRIEGPVEPADAESAARIRRLIEETARRLGEKVDEEPQAGDA